MKGFKFERNFPEIAKEEGMILEYVEQSRKSIKKFKKENNRVVKRPDFLLLNSDKKIYFELKCYTVYSPEFGNSFFKFSYKEMKGLSRFKQQTNAKEIYILFLDQKKKATKENIIGLSLSKLEEYVDIKNQRFPVIQRKTIHIYLKELEKFYLIKI